MPGSMHGQLDHLRSWSSTPSGQPDFLHRQTPFETPGRRAGGFLCARATILLPLFAPSLRVESLALKRDFATSVLPEDARFNQHLVTWIIIDQMTLHGQYPRRYL